ncbi:MAG: rod shape-determining protein MreC [bacterium]|nr:rod shape-determining protein MreC [bacterium]
MDWTRVSVNFLNWPVVKTLEKFQSFTSVFFNIREIAEQNSILSRQVEELSLEVARGQKAKNENKLLSEALGFVSQSNHELIPAQVITFDIFNFSQTVSINRGRNHGVEEGLAVVASKGLLVGVVTEVLDHTSQVELITSSAVKVNAEVVPSGASGIVRGEHGLGLLLDLVSQDEIINPKDRVITSGLGGQFPKNFLIGEVHEVISGGPELFLQASIIPAANLRGNKIVFVVKK